jgi:hypothetical protein
MRLESKTKSGLKLILENKVKENKK